MSERQRESKGIRKHKRDLKAEINRELPTTQADPWKEIEAKLTAKFGQETVVTNYAYLHDYFETRTRILGSANPLAAQESEITAFQDRHPDQRERIANAPLTRVIQEALTPPVASKARR